MSIRSRWFRLLFSIPAGCLLMLPLFASVEEGDAHWERRAEGHRGAVASPEPVNAAIDAYRAAMRNDPSNLEARWKLMRALRFKGAYVVSDNDRKKDLFDEGRRIGEKGVEIVEAKLRKLGLSQPDEAAAEDVARAAKRIPGAGELYLWSAINWGEWAQLYGKLAAVRKGAAGQIRRQATIALEIDPAMEGAGPGRVLGRLHNQTPRVPFLTGWASDEEAVTFLKKSLELNPGDKLTMVYLGEAMVAADRRTKPRAIEILKKVIETRNDPEFAVEGASAQQDARRLLAELER